MENCNFLFINFFSFTNIYFHISWKNKLKMLYKKEQLSSKIKKFNNHSIKFE